MTMVIERIEIVMPIGDRPAAIMASRVEEISEGRYLPANPINLLVGKFDSSQLPPEIATVIDGINSEALAEKNSLTTEVELLKTERDSLKTEKDSLLETIQQAEQQIESLQLRIQELLTPVSPYPETDWQGFRSAALASPIILKMATSNMGNFMMLLIYLTEMQKDQSAALKMAVVWNEMENKTPLTQIEIEAINNLAASFKVPLTLNSEGQIN